MTASRHIHRRHRAQAGQVSRGRLLTEALRALVVLRRGRLLTEALRALVVLRRGRWTVQEMADELGIMWRSGYRLIASLRAAGVTVEVSREHGPGKRGYLALYRVPAEALRKLLRL